MNHIYANYTVTFWGYWVLSNIFSQLLYITLRYITTRWFIICGPICLNWYVSANKRYFYVKFWLFVAQIIIHTHSLYTNERPLPSITVSVWHNLLCCVYIVSCHWQSGSEEVTFTSALRWKEASLNTTCLNKLWLTCICSVYVHLRLSLLTFVANDLLFQYKCSMRFWLHNLSEGHNIL